MLEVGVVGYDHAHLPRYIPALAENPRIKLVALVAPGANRALAKQDAEKYRCRYLEEIPALREGKKIDAAYIGTPPNQHLNVIRELAPQGIHVLCDKPLATTLKDADGNSQSGEKTRDQTHGSLQPALSDPCDAA